jgi:hypothetical protein
MYFSFYNRPKISALKFVSQQCVEVFYPTVPYNLLLYMLTVKTYSSWSANRVYCVLSAKGCSSLSAHIQLTIHISCMTGYNYCQQTNDLSADQPDTNQWHTNQRETGQRATESTKICKSSHSLLKIKCVCQL